ncbi:NF038130 family PEP-CTERM protein [Okeania sp.]|uniref:NF038130 family PEP-CTERM protein n=1 Tax=Okeania sp. TaxID=3100323 RepID=UPI002B4B4CDC|nr:NF038130 family PEP-CTERM protein [Okeania sp.]MEB3343686.1 NF038130 family PEP-CTERM protein [Okeania sp.]
MTGLVKKFLASASVIVGMSAVIGAPAMAAKFTVSGDDYNVYDSYNRFGKAQEDTTFKVSQKQVNNFGGINKVIDYILAGDSGTPGANIELGQSEGNNSIVKINFQTESGKNVTISNDIKWTEELSRNWFSGIWEQVQQATIESKKEAFAESYAIRYVESTSDPNYNVRKQQGKQIFETSYRKLYENYEQALSSLIGLSSDDAYDKLGGWVDDILAMATDPNISYIYEDAGSLTVGLAGHYNLADRIAGGLAEKRDLLAFLLEGVQGSEIFAYNIDGKTGYGWSNSATYSGLKEKSDGFSHSGNYEVTIDVPEPSTILGLIAIGSLVVATKRKSAK